eukprot:GGOE01009181.1.p3 GENE.GGOE01009181.1~~GGOE01009181.1.p3  ORF type:complete len:103 (+),score=3.73 GGOE01009181.1:547-855(+)
MLSSLRRVASPQAWQLAKSASPRHCGSCLADRIHQVNFSAGPHLYISTTPPHSPAIPALLGALDVRCTLPFSLPLCCVRRAYSTFRTSECHRCSSNVHFVWS